MEVFVYFVYLIGILAAFSALIVRVFASLPTELVVHGEHAGRFADLGAPQAAKGRKTMSGGRVTTIDVPKARAA
jgi:hypothetical protein